MIYTPVARFSKFVFLLISTFLHIRDSEAQQPSPNPAGLSVTASHEIKLDPIKVRLVLPVRVETRESDSILKTLKVHEKQVKKELLAIGVPATEIGFSTPLVTAGVPGVENPEAARNAVRQQAIQMRNMNPQLKNQFPIPAVYAIDDFDLPIVYSADTILTVDWKLENGLDEAAILLPSKLKMLIEEKGFSGKQLREVLSAEETKLIEPLMGNQAYYAQQNRLKDNRLFYVAEMTDEQERAAFVESVKKATAQANVLAQSAGLRLGKLKSIHRIPVVDPMALQANNWILEQTGANVTVNRVKNDREVTNVDSNGLKRTLTVNMVFEVE